MVVSNYKVANQFIKVDPKTGETILQSYKSDVVRIFPEENRVALGSDWNYSRTTLKYVAMFLRDCGYDVITKKDIQALLDDGTFNRF